MRIREWGLGIRELGFGGWNFFAFALTKNC